MGEEQHGRIAALALLLLLLAAACCAEAARLQPNSMVVADSATRPRKADFDYFYLVRQWPASFCNEHACTHRPPRRYAFTVHGLWPQRRDGTWPEFCAPGDELDVDEIADLVPDMARVWPSWSASANEDFWNHEWTRHGTCAATVLGGHQHAFFADALALHWRLNVQAALRASGILPSNSRTYLVDDIKKAVDRVHGVLPHVTCDADGELAEVWMCVSKRLRPVDCVDGPHPHLVAAVRAAAAGQFGVSPDAAAAPANYNCDRVKIPKLRRAAAGGVGDGAELEADDGDARWDDAELLEPAATQQVAVS